jgi:hypothetical protein
MHQNRNVILFYLSVALLAITATLHVTIDPPDTPADIVSHILFAGSVAFLLLMTLFVFRPQIKAISKI